ncbi:Aste57867_2361 [Aphanomyces stellatus]|uniref:Aste57867_2361 protein n=1 Tax=Aphanomyces stellatus TaxID=120398 RepID=A0A485KBP2_9STRA|nr:hypothetical protein As57867_002356 [Aphanomyces stellatus]VFT79562.1 Aste57867_2361 [Aphanomyces stellatus]
MAATAPLYGGRAFVPTIHAEPGIKTANETVSVLTYNVMRQMHATPAFKPYCDPSVLTATRRKEQILQELLSYNADILCLQEVDDFHLWWVPRLNAAGYDSVYHQRTGDYDDGLVIAFRRILFQIFRTQRINLNDVHAPNATVAAHLQQDNVALLVALQPWETCHFPSAVCVVNVQLASHPDREQVRRRQIEHLLPLVEVFNADFQMPLVLAGSFNVTPESHVYHILRTGRPRPGPEPPERMARPRADEPSTSTITVTWDPPLMHGPVLAYRVDRRVNGSTTVGFAHEVVVEDPTATSFKATMLSAGTTYEFRVAVKNGAGWGEYSAPTLPCMTLTTRSSGVGKPPVVIPLEPTVVNPFQPSYGSGKTPRYTDGSTRLDMCPRPVHAATQPYETVHRRGDREDKLLHFEVLESAYGTYYHVSEPDYTYSDHVFIGTVDYIFYSKKELQATHVLSLPPLDSLDGDDARQAPTVPDVDYSRLVPDGWNTFEPKLSSQAPNPKYQGEWTTEMLRLPNTTTRKHHWLPNSRFSSDHVALMAILAFHADELAVSWN